MAVWVSSIITFNFPRSDYNVGVKRYGLLAFLVIFSSLSILSYPNRIEALEETVTEQELREESLSFKPRKRELLRIKKIAIDPGHGGRDFGAKSRNLFLEKEFTHRLATALKKTIEDQNGRRVSVILTRTGRNDTDQYKRAFAANSSEAHVYLSLHTASGYDQSSRDLGIYLSEKGTLKAGSDSWKDINRKYSAYNAVLAGMFRKNLDGFYEHKKFFIRRGKFIPLFGIDMPGVLIEVIALNDPKDELMINEEEFYEKLAQVLYAALVDYDQTL